MKTNFKIIGWLGVVAVIVAAIAALPVNADTKKIEPRPAACSIGITVYADRDHIDLTPVDRTGHQHRVGLDVYDMDGEEQKVHHIGGGVFRHYLQDGDAGNQFLAQSNHYMRGSFEPFCWDDAVYYAPGK